VVERDVFTPNLLLRVGTIIDITPTPAEENMQVTLVTTIDIQDTL